MGPLAGTRMGVPCSLRSLFHGLSLVTVMLLCLGLWVSLWQINYHEHYRGRSACRAGNTIGVNGGGDNFLYCPNTRIVANGNITAPYPLTLHHYNTTADNIPLLNTTNTFTWSQSLWIEDDDDENWWLNFNPGSSVFVEFTNMNGSVPATLFIDDDDAFVIPAGNSTFTYTQETLKGGLPSRGYEFHVHSTTDVVVENTVGNVAFSFNQTVYDASSSVDQCFTNLRKPSCLYSYEFGEDSCLLVVSGGSTYQIGSDYTAYCPVLQQDGRDPAWMGFLIPSTIVLVLLVLLINVVVGLWLEHRAAKYRPVY